MRPALRPTRLLTAVAIGAALVAAPATASGATTPRPYTPVSTTPRPVPVAASGYTFSAADQRMRTKLTQRVTTTAFGTAFSGTVIDAASNTRIWSLRGTTTELPASTAKLVTAHNALTVFGPDKRFRTSVRQGSAIDRVVVEGGGDPLLSSAALDAMAATTATTLKARGRTSIRVYVDDDVFPTPTLAPGWKTSYVPDSITPVRGLVRDQRDVADTSADVGSYVASRLKARGLTATYAGRENVRSGAETLASSDGATMTDIVGRMLLVSDNEIAEALHKLVGRSAGGDATWTGARAAQTRVLQQAGLSVGAMYDGSGLSRSDRISSQQLATVMDRAVDSSHAELAPMRSSRSLPIAGRTGTLAAKYDRFTSSASRCAAGKVWAKTGTLSDVASLAGYTRDPDGRIKVFAFIVNGRTSSTALKQGLDLLAATVNGCS